MATDLSDDEADARMEMYNADSSRPNVWQRYPLRG